MRPGQPRPDEGNYRPDLQCASKHLQDSNRLLIVTDEVSKTQPVWPEDSAVGAREAGHLWRAEHNGFRCEALILDLDEYSILDARVEDAPDRGIMLYPGLHGLLHL